MNTFKPCDKCNKNISQYIDEGQVTCYLKCEKWKEWWVNKILVAQAY